MSFQPVVPVSGLSGWTFLQKTLTRQTALFDKFPQLERDTDYFTQNIARIDDADALIADRRLLRVALGAFGLQDDINSQALIRQVLTEGTEDDETLANKLADDRYKRLSAAFGFGDAEGPRTQEAGFADRINTLFRRRGFEQAVGDQDQALRLAMNAQRELADIARRDESENARWFTIMGQPPLREVFETVLGLPPGFGQLDIDRQLDEFKTRADSQLDLTSLDDLADPEVLEKLVERFLLRDQISAGLTMTGNAIALTLLQSAPTRFAPL